MKVRKKINWKIQIPFYIMMIPGVVYLIINNYLPIYGVLIAFKKLDFAKGIFDSPFIGLKNFEFLFKSSDAWTITRNTIGYNIAFFIIGTSLSITIAILLNEVRSKYASKLYQSAILLPFLMSWVIVSYLGYTFLSAESGLFNTIFKSLGLEPVNWYNKKEYWPFIIIITNMWKTVGYSVIIYFSSIVGISKEFYEAAVLDGATKWQQIKNITLPMIKPTVIILFILSIGNIFRSDFGLFYQLPKNSGALYSVTRTLDVYVYNALMKNNNFGMSSAAAFYQAFVGLFLVILANKIVKKYSKDNALF